MKQFHIGDVLSVSTGYFVGPTDFGAVHGLIEYLMGEPIFTHALPIVAELCKEVVLKQHPKLVDVDMSDVTPENHRARLAEQMARFGEYIALQPIGGA